MAQWIAHQTSNLGVAGSNPVECASLFLLFPPVVPCRSYRHLVLFLDRNASIAQLAEHAPRKRKVTSSILVGGF